MVELMIVIAIIAILAAIALPAYQDFTVRARVSEALALASGARATISENIHNDNELNTDACVGVVSLAAPTNNTSTFDCSGQGVLTMTTTAKAGLITLRLAPSYTPDEPITWKCTLASGDPKYVPAECRMATSS